MWVPRPLRGQQCTPVVYRELRSDCQKLRQIHIFLYWLISYRVGQPSTHCALCSPHGFSFEVSSQGCHPGRSRSNRGRKARLWPLVRHPVGYTLFVPSLVTLWLSVYTWGTIKFLSRKNSTERWTNKAKDSIATQVKQITYAQVVYHALIVFKKKCKLRRKRIKLILKQAFNEAYCSVSMTH